MRERPSQPAACAAPVSRFTAPLGGSWRHADAVATAIQVEARAKALRDRLEVLAAERERMLQRMHELNDDVERLAAEVRGLQAALESRDVIGQAKGRLIERFQLDPDTAWELLVSASQRSHVRIRDVAATLVTTGHVPQLTRVPPQGS